MLVCPWRQCWAPPVCVSRGSRGNAAQKVHPRRPWVMAQDVARTRPSGRPKDGVRKKQARAEPICVLSERDREPPGQRCDRGRRRPPGPGGALHVRAPRHGGPDRGEGTGSAPSLAGCTWQEGRGLGGQAQRWEPRAGHRDERDGGGGRGGETSVRLRGRRGAGRRAPWPGPSAAPAAPRLQGVPRPLPRAGGHPGDGRAVVGPLGAPGHGDHHQQRPDHVQRAAAPAPGGWRLPRKDGCQVRRRRVLAARPAGLSSRRGPRVLPPPARPRLAAG